MQSTEAEVTALPTLLSDAQGAVAAEVAPLPLSQKVPPRGPAVRARSGEAAPGSSFSRLGSLARSPARLSLSLSLFFVLLKRTLRAPGGAPRSHWLPPIICQSRHFGGSAALIVAQTRFQVS